MMNAQTQQQDQEFNSLDIAFLAFLKTLPGAQRMEIAMYLLRGTEFGVVEAPVAKTPVEAEPIMPSSAAHIAAVGCVDAETPVSLPLLKNRVSQDPIHIEWANIAAAKQQIKEGIKKPAVGTSSSKKTVKIGAPSTKLVVAAKRSAKNAENAFKAGKITAKEMQAAFRDWVKAEEGYLASVKEAGFDSKVAGAQEKLDSARGQLKNWAMKQKDAASDETSQPAMQFSEWKLWKEDKKEGAPSVEGRRAFLNARETYFAASSLKARRAALKLVMHAANIWLEKSTKSDVLLAGDAIDFALREKGKIEAEAEEIARRTAPKGLAKRVKKVKEVPTAKGKKANGKGKK